MAIDNTTEVYREFDRPFVSKQQWWCMAIFLKQMISKRILSIQSNNVSIWYFVFVTWFFLEQILEE